MRMIIVYILKLVRTVMSTSQDSVLPRILKIKQTQRSSQLPATIRRQYEILQQHQLHAYEQYSVVCWLRAVALPPCDVLARLKKPACIRTFLNDFRCLHVQLRTLGGAGMLPAVLLSSATKHSPPTPNFTRLGELI